MFSSEHQWAIIGSILAFESTKTVIAVKTKTKPRTRAEIIVKQQCKVYFS
jgi:hypothetical protein